MHSNRFKPTREFKYSFSCEKLRSALYIIWFLKFHPLLFQVFPQLYRVYLYVFSGFYFQYSYSIFLFQDFLLELSSFKPFKGCFAYLVIPFQKIFHELNSSSHWLLVRRMDLLHREGGRREKASTDKKQIFHDHAPHPFNLKLHRKT